VNCSGKAVNIKLMVPSGYSGTPLLKKLGIKPGMKMLLIHAPEEYNDLLGIDVSSFLCKEREKPDFVHLFVNSEDHLYLEMQKLKPLIHPQIIIWVSWYKKTSGVKTDITEDSIRNYALQNNLVDVKVCAVDEKWSALKLVVPLAKR
jgi:hypothetical protein